MTHIPFIPFGMTRLGKCSICGGDVLVPTVYYSTIPPTPTCVKCGAIKDDSGPTIPMKLNEKNFNTNNTHDNPR